MPNPAMQALCSPIRVGASLERRESVSLIQTTAGARSIRVRYQHTAPTRLTRMSGMTSSKTRLVRPDDMRTSQSRVHKINSNAIRSRHLSAHNVIDKQTSTCAIKTITSSLPKPGRKISSLLIYAGMYSKTHFLLDTPKSQHHISLDSA